MKTGVQVFGRHDSRDTQKALRFFKERRVPIAFVDVTRKAPAAGELRRFSERFGSAALLDRNSHAYHESGLGYMRLDEAELFTFILERPALLRLPLVRAGNRVSIGSSEGAWREWLSAER